MFSLSAYRPGSLPNSPAGCPPSRLERKLTIKARELKDALQSCHTLKDESATMKKTLDDLQTALEEKDKMLRNAEYERDLLEKEKVLYDTQVKVGSFERPVYNVASLALFMQNCQNTSIKPSRLPLCHNKEGSIMYLCLCWLWKEFYFFSACVLVYGNLACVVWYKRHARASVPFAPPVLSRAHIPCKRLLGRPTEIMLSTFVKIMFLTL